MKPYIQQTVLDLDVQIELLTTTRNTLLTLNVELPPELKLPPGLPPLADFDAPLPPPRPQIVSESARARRPRARKARSIAATVT